MTCVGVLHGERRYVVRLQWARSYVTGGRDVCCWWLVSIDGDPRPSGAEVWPIYRRAVELATRAVTSPQPD